MLIASGYNVTDVEDSRGIFERLSRQSLYYLFIANGIKNVHDSTPKPTMLKIAEINQDKLLAFSPDGRPILRNVNAYINPADGSLKIERPSPAVLCEDEKKPDDLGTKEAKKSKKGDD